jgi:lipoprotein-releasing system ATP-binding protein
MPDLIVENITKEFPTRAESLQVLRGISLEMSRGENLAILGPSGSGKSTLLYILGTLDQPTSGQVSLLGQNPFALDEPRLADFRNGHIGFIFQDHYLLPQCSVLENVLLPTIAHSGANGALVERAKLLIDRVGLSDRIDYRPAELSGGQRQRVAVARALMRNPDVLLADEPTGNLDRTSATTVAELLLDLQRESQTILIVVTHNLELAAKFARRLELDAGHLKPAT